MKPISYARHQFPPSVIQQAVGLYQRFRLSYRDVEELLAERGLEARPYSSIMRESRKVPQQTLQPPLQQSLSRRGVSLSIPTMALPDGGFVRNRLHSALRKLREQGHEGSPAVHWSNL